VVGVGLELMVILLVLVICDDGAELGSGFVSGEEGEMDVFVGLMMRLLKIGGVGA